jgi:hypothetical protein
MIQLLPKVAFNAGYGGATSYIGVLGGNGDFSAAIVGGANFAKAPVALASTFRNLTVLATDLFAVDVTVTLMVDGVASTQTVTLPAGEALAVSTGAEVVVAAGQDVTYRYTGTNPAGSNLSVCIEREGVGNIYGLTPAAGSLAVDTGWYGGAFNNGTMAAYDPTPDPGDSNTYSLTAAAGTITTLMLRTYAGAPGSGIWTGYLRKNGIIQDGTGGTVDTQVVMTGTDTVVTGTFALSVALTDRVDVAVVRTGAAAPFAVAQVAVGIGFTPTVADVFMMCGGSNDAISHTQTDWKWTLSEQLAAGEASHVAPISATGLTISGLYIERGDAPGAGRGYVHTVRRSGADTPAVVTIEDVATEGLIDGLDVSFASGQTITLQSMPVADGATDPVSSTLYWGLAAFAGTTPEPPPEYEEVTIPIRRLRRAPHLSDEQVTMFHARLQIDLEAGVGLVDGQGADPQVMVRWSDDGGHTWSSEQWRSAGKIGQYRHRVVFWRLGRARDRIYEMVVSDPVAWHIIDAYLDVEAGTH